MLVDAGGLGDVYKRQIYICFFFFKQKTAYEIMPSLVGSEMCIRDSYNFRYLRSNSCVFRLVIKDLIYFSKNSPIIPNVRIIQPIYFGTLIQFKTFQVNLCCLNRFMPQ